jgi:hypothetical protein
MRAPASCVPCAQGSSPRAMYGRARSARLGLTCCPIRTACLGTTLQVALVCDAALGNYQKRVLQQGCTVQQLMLYQSLAGMVAMGAACVTSGAPRVD